MTRENKLVMVIGFGLLLFVGILVSDHLSARDSQFAQPDSIVDVKLEQVRQLPVAEEERLKSFGQPERGAEGAAEIDGRRVVILPPVEPNGGVGGGVAPPVPQPPAPEPVRTHTIAKGDNPEKIAQKYYGKRTLAVALAKYNGIDPSKLRIGQTLKIPDIVELDPSAARTAQAPAQQVETVPQPPVEPPAQSPKFRMVTVQKGDTLWKIAQRELGNGARSKDIVKLNPGLNPNGMRPGQQLKVASAG